MHVMTEWAMPAKLSSKRKIVDYSKPTAYQLSGDAAEEKLEQRSSNKKETS